MSPVHSPNHALYHCASFFNPHLRTRKSSRRIVHTLLPLTLIIALLLQSILTVATAPPLLAASRAANADPTYSPAIQEEPIPPDEGLIDGLQTPDTPPLEPPIEEPPAAPSPVSLTLSSRKGTLTPNSASQLTVRVFTNQAVEADLMTLQVTLPETLESAGNGHNSISEWSLPAMDAGEEFSEKLVLKVVKDPGPLPQATTVTATVSGEGLAPLVVALELGLLKKRGGQPDPAPRAVQSNAGTALTNEYEDVSLVAPVAAAAEGTEFAYAPLYDWQTGDGESAALDVAMEAITIDAKKPPAEPKGRQVGAVRVYKHFDLTATNDDENISQLDGEVSIDIDVADLIAQGVDLTGFNIWTRESEEDAWRVVPSAFDITELHFRVKTAHFTEFSLGKGLTSTGNTLPSVKAFTVDQLTGAAHVNIPIKTPSGLGGMAPALSFGYSNMEMDDQRNAYGDWNDTPSQDEGFRRKVQQESSVGTGWSLSGISYITNVGIFEGDDSAKRFSLVINGQSATITCAKQLHAGADECLEWRTAPEMFAKIEWLGDESGGDEFKAEDFSMWTIKTADGMVYTFGDAGDFNSDPNSNATQTSAVSTLITRTAQDEDNVRFASRWYLRSVTDSLGNQMEYSYQQEYGREKGDHDTNNDPCIDEGWADEDLLNWYTRAVYPTEIRWSGHTDGNPGYRMRVEFDYRTRFTGDDPAPVTDPVRIYGDSDTDCVMPNYGIEDELENIYVQVMDASGAWHIIRAYHMNYSTQHFLTTTSINRHTQFRRMLSSVEERGKNGAGVLRTHSFGYILTAPNKYFLLLVKNGWGGEIVYKYSSYPIACSGAVCPHAEERHAVTERRVVDGLLNMSKQTYYLGPHSPEWAVRADDGSFLGFKEVHITYYDAQSMYSGAPWSPLRYESAYSFIATTSAADRSNPDPRRGRIRVSRVCNQRCDQPSGRVIYENTVNDYKIFWKERNFNNGTSDWVDKTSLGDTWYRHLNVNNQYEQVYPAIWVRQESVTVTDNNGASNRQVFAYYESQQNNHQFGNVTHVTEYGDNNAFLRKTVTDYIPNTTKNIVSLPARVKVFSNSTGTQCVSETRMIYGGNGLGSHYRTQPQNTLLVKTEKALTACSNSTVSYHGNNNWGITYASYDSWGNPTQQIVYGTNGANNSVLNTTYDTTFRLFPLTQTMGNETETAKYYGVNTPSPWYTLNKSGAYFGGMAEYCGVNGVCTRQIYDDFGRPKNRWDTVTSSKSWSADWGSAKTTWSYSPPGGDHATFMVVEKHEPSAEGNFVRKHYDGLGQLVLEQMPYQDWMSNGSTATGQEIHVNHQYDGLGREIRTSVPHLMPPRSYNIFFLDWLTLDHTRMTYDGRSRLYDSYAPNDVQTQHRYGKRSASSKVIGINGDSNRMMRWQQTDAMGNLSYVRTYSPNGSGWTNTARIALFHDAMGNLTTVVQASNTGATFLYYDLAGRKTGMNDSDLGEWSYTYDRKGNLIRQTDARNKSVCLTYDTLNRLRYKRFEDGTACPGLNNTNSHERYTYGSSGASKGQLSQIYYPTLPSPEKNYGSYRKNLYYNSKGLLYRERVKIGGAPSAYYNTYTYYDVFNRLYKVRYPDGDEVTTDYTGMGGLPDKLESSVNGTLVDSVEYDAVGRLTRMRMPQGTDDLWRQQYYYEWEGQSTNKRNGNGLLKEIRVGTGENESLPASYNRLHLTYHYDSFANILYMIESYNGGGEIPYSMAYDDQSRVRWAFNKSYHWQHAGNFTYFENKNFIYDSVHKHALDKVNGVNRYDYDANGNMTARRINQSSAQTLEWNDKNQLKWVEASATGTIIEQYWYGADGIRIRKQSGSVNNFYVNPFYEVQTTSSVVTAQSPEVVDPAEMGDEEWVAQLDAEMAQLLSEDELLALEADPYNGKHPADAYKTDEELADAQDDEDAPDIGEGIAAAEHSLYLPVVSHGDKTEVQAAAINATTFKKYYYFNSMRIAMKQTGIALTYLHADHLGSTVLTTEGSINNSQSYFAFGAKRDGGTLTTDHKFTGQKLDGTGLMYFNARYYDPEVGQFISPDTLVPNPTVLVDYNRYMYARGNPLKYSDPSGHVAIAEGGAHWSPLVIIMNGIRQQNGVMPSHSLELQTNLVEAGYPERSTYVTGPTYTGGTALDVASVAYQHNNADVGYGGWAETRVPVRKAVKQIRSDNGTVIDLFPGREVVLVAHSGGAPTATVIGDWLADEYAANVTGIVTIGSILVNEDRAAEVADQVHIVSAKGDILGYSEFVAPSFELPENVSRYWTSWGGHGSYASDPKLFEIFRDEIPGMGYLQIEP